MTNKELETVGLGKLLWDDQVKGLHVRAFATKRSFYVYYRTKSGTQRRPKLGDYPTLSIDSARKAAKELLARVALGEDPSLDRQMARGEMTVAELFSVVWDKHWTQEKFRQSGHAGKVYQLWKANISPHFGTKQVSELTPPMIRDWLMRYKEIPYTGNRSLNALGRMFTFAEEEGLRPVGSNPCARVKAFDEPSRERYASDQEIHSVGEILERESEKHSREVAFIYLLLFTGSRPSFIERARPADLEHRETGGASYGVLTLGGKTGREKVYLPPQAMKALSKVKPEQGFLVGRYPRSFWERVRKEAGCPDLRARDWRRTFATTGMSEGFEMAVISELLNHKSAQTTKVYAKLKDSSRHQVASATASKMEKLLKGDVA